MCRGSDYQRRILRVPAKQQRISLILRSKMADVFFAVVGTTVTRCPSPRGIRGLPIASKQVLAGLRLYTSSYQLKSG